MEFIFKNGVEKWDQGREVITTQIPPEFLKASEVTQQHVVKPPKKTQYARIAPRPSEPNSIDYLYNKLKK